MQRIRSAVERALNRSPQERDVKSEHARGDKAMRERDNAIQIMGALQEHIGRRIEVLKHEADPYRRQRVHNRDAEQT